MRRLRQASPFVFSFVVFLLHCSQTCLAAGHAYAVVTVPSAAHHSAEHAPCHSPPTVPQGPSERCPDCADHVFLTSVSAGAQTLAASGAAFIPLCVLTQPVILALPQSHAGVFWLDPTALSPPLSRTPSVLRL